MCIYKGGLIDACAMRFVVLSICLLVLLISFLHPFEARRHVLVLKDEGRKTILCSHFGFTNNSYFSISIAKLEGDVKHVTFTLDKSGVSGVASYIESKISNCFRDQSFKVLYLSFDIETQSLLIHRNDAQLNGLIFEADLSSMYDNGELPPLKSLFGKINHALVALKVVANSDRQIVDSVIEFIRSSTVLSYAAEFADSSSINGAQRPIYQLLYKSAIVWKNLNKSGVLDSVFQSIIARILPSGILKSIPYTVVNGAITTNFTIRMPSVNEAGLYSLFLHNCAEINVESGKRSPINLVLKMVEKNPTSYLSIGQQPLPKLYASMCLAYLISSIVWLVYLLLSKKSVFRIHYLMLVVVLFKSISLGFHSINYYVIGRHGVPEEGWVVMYYITHVIRGALLFITILLIGAGWTFIKHMLTPRERNIFLIIIPLQILANIATVIIEESETGTARYARWKEIFIFIDLVCCCAILFPVIWSIKHLKSASQTDGKAAINLRNLRLFRHFYILVICYVYFTRVIVYLMSITIIYPYSWLVELFKEFITLSFFISVAYKFRPFDSNPYLLVSNDDDEDVVMERLQMEEVWSQSGVTDGVTRVHRFNNNAAGTTNGKTKTTMSAGSNRPNYSDRSSEHRQALLSALDDEADQN